VVSQSRPRPPSRAQFCPTMAAEQNWSYLEQNKGRCCRLPDNETRG